MSLLQAISSENFITVNRTLIKKLGLEAAVLLGELASEHVYWSEREELKDGFFFSTIENIEEKTGLTGYQQRQAINKLAEAGIIECKKMGIPAKRYIRIIEQQVVNLFNDKKSKNLTTGDEEISQQEVKKLHSNKTKDNKTEERDRKDIYIKKPAEDKPKKPRFVAPTIEDIRSYCHEIGSTIDPEYFFDYYKSNGWMAGKVKMTDWKATVRNWSRRQKERPQQSQSYVNPFTELKRQEGLL